MSTFPQGVNFDALIVADAPAFLSGLPADELDAATRYYAWEREPTEAELAELHERGADDERRNDEAAASAAAASAAATADAAAEYLIQQPEAAARLCELRKFPGGYAGQKQLALELPAIAARVAPAAHDPFVAHCVAYTLSRCPWFSTAVAMGRMFTAEDERRMEAGERAAARARPARPSRPRGPLPAEARKAAGRLAAAGAA